MGNYRYYMQKGIYDTYTLGYIYLLYALSVQKGTYLALLQYLILTTVTKEISLNCDNV